ncbi:MAG: methylmalonyl-CoA epimerase [Candidatus Eisenbacteria bacterium]
MSNERRRRVRREDTEKTGGRRDGRGAARDGDIGSTDRSGRDQGTPRDGEAPILGVEHIGIAVKDAVRASEMMCRLLGGRPSETQFARELGLNIVFVQAGGVSMEFLEPLSESGPIAKFLETRGEGFHHIAFRVRDIEDMLAGLRQAGVRLVEPAPSKGAHGNLVAFIHPSATPGILVELCERKERS